jgi:hypothetical protein
VAGDRSSHKAQYGTYNKALHKGWGIPITKYSTGGSVAWRVLSGRGDQYGLKYGLQTTTFCFVNETSKPTDITEQRSRLGFEESQNEIYSILLVYGKLKR